MSENVMTYIGNTFGASQVLVNFYRFLRRNLQHSVAAFVPLILLYFRSDIAQNFQSQNWSVAAYYAAIFDWSSIQSAFLFGIYAFLLSRSEPFLKAIANTSVFEQMRSHVRHVMYSAMLLTVTSLPLLVTSPDVGAEYSDYGLWIFIVVTSFATYTSLAFLKVVRVFHKIERARK